jgi:hypothetical protein
MEAHYFDDHPSYHERVVEAVIEDTEPAFRHDGIDYYHAHTYLRNGEGVVTISISKEVLSVMIPMGEFNDA